MAFAMKMVPMVSMREQAIRHLSNFGKAESLIQSAEYDILDSQNICRDLSAGWTRNDELVWLDSPETRSAQTTSRTATRGSSDVSAEFNGIAADSRALQDGRDDCCVCGWPGCYRDVCAAFRPRF